MKLSGLGKLFAMLYDDRMDIYRTQADTNEDGTIDISYEPQPLYTNVECRLSFSSNDTATDSEVDLNPVKLSPKLFCKPTVDLKAGDYVEVRRYTDDGTVAVTYRGQVALPSWYSTHQEVFIRVDEGA